MANKLNMVGISGIVIGILGVAGPILWDYYKTKSEITIRTVEQSIVIEKPKKLDGLVITYNGEQLNELSKISIDIANTGRNPVTERDIVKPINIIFSNLSPLIDANIELMRPQNLGASIQINKEKNSILLLTPLLNSNDQIVLSALTKSASAEYEVDARIAGTSIIKAQDPVARGGGRRSRPWTIYPVGFFSAVLTLVAFFGVFSAPSELKTKKQLKNRSFALPNLNSRNDFLVWVDKHFYFCTTTERKPLKNMIKNLPDTQNFSTAHEQALLGGIRQLVESAVPNLTMALVCFVISGIGAWYVFSNW